MKCFRVIMSKRRKPQAVFGGCIYNLHVKHADGRIYWKCRDYWKTKCVSGIFTQGPNVVCVRFPEHNHSAHERDYSSDYELEDTSPFTGAVCEQQEGQAAAGVRRPPVQPVRAGRRPPPGVGVPAVQAAAVPRAPAAGARRRAGAHGPAQPPAALRPRPPEDAAAGPPRLTWMLQGRINHRGVVLLQCLDSRTLRVTTGFLNPVRKKENRNFSKSHLVKFFFFPTFVECSIKIYMNIALWLSALSV
ncbi:uncharacterized protein LOC134534011 isoform X2 [Bacillus rossius redtenbacheri]|uniref:uncharacterized protein LOC134534011 isoform X2 n=1 Tax=Bacillus rossius redtenbacheri TaxID=93214 RepID=UPI002FDDEDE5